MVLTWAMRSNKGAETAAETQEEEECRRICTMSASATIHSIEEFIERGIVSRLSSWYML